jgi:protein-S-isoprenylcysteine O-methyltransferase Ste14
VVIPLILFATGQQSWSDISLSMNGLIFSGLAGVAGAVGAICVVFATKAAIGAANADGVPPATYKVYIAPIIFGLAPVINVLISIVWHPKPGNWMHFDFEMPGWKLLVGIVLVGAGAALVVFSKEEAEAAKSKPQAAQLTPEVQPRAEPAS